MTTRRAALPQSSWTSDRLHETSNQIVRKANETWPSAMEERCGLLSIAANRVTSKTSPQRLICLGCLRSGDTTLVVRRLNRIAGNEAVVIDTTNHLVAQANSAGQSVATLKLLFPNSRKRMSIPEAYNASNVPFHESFSLYREFGLRIS